MESFAALLSQRISFMRSVFADYRKRPKTGTSITKRVSEKKISIKK
jgi:hypothetical protein